MKTNIIYIFLGLCLALLFGAAQYEKPQRTKSVIVISTKVQDTLNKYNYRGWSFVQMEPFNYYTDGRTCGGAMDYPNDYYIGVDSYILIFEK